MEGLAYLTFDADVKEEFVEDKAAMQAMFQLAKVGAERCGANAGWGERARVPLLMEGVGAPPAGLWLGCAQGSGGAEQAQALLCPVSRVRRASHFPCSRRTGACSMQLPPRW